MRLAKEHFDEVENLLELCGDELYGLIGAEPRTGDSRITVARTILAPSGDIKISVSEGSEGDRRCRSAEAMVFVNGPQDGVWGRKADMPPQEWNRGLLRLLRAVLMEEIRGEDEVS